MKKFLNILSYVGAAILLFYGVSFIIKGFPVISAIILIIAGILALPFSTKIIYQTTGKSITTKGKGVSISVLIILSFGFMVFKTNAMVMNQRETEQKTQEEKTKEFEKVKATEFLIKKNEFLKDKSNIINKIKGLIEKGSYEDAKKYISGYLVYQDPDINNINKEIDGFIKRQIDKERTSVLIKELKTIPHGDSAKRKNVYAELVKLNPDNKIYKEKLALYIKEEAIKASMKTEYDDLTTDQQAIEHILVAKQAIKDSSKDSDSVQFKEVFYRVNRSGVPVVCGQYNAKNSFGGYLGYQHFLTNGLNVVATEESVTDFNKLWNQFCAD